MHMHVRRQHDNLTQRGWREIRVTMYMNICHSVVLVILSLSLSPSPLLFSSQSGGLKLSNVRRQKKSQEQSQHEGHFLQELTSASPSSLLPSRSTKLTLHFTTLHLGADEP